MQNISGRSKQNIYKLQCRTQLKVSQWHNAAHSTNVTKLTFIVLLSTCLTSSLGGALRCINVFLLFGLDWCRSVLLGDLLMHFNARLQTCFCLSSGDRPSLKIFVSRNCNIPRSLFKIQPASSSTTIILLAT